MNIRRIVYITAICLIAGYFYYNQQTTTIPVPDPIDQKTVLQAFKGHSSKLPEDLIKVGYQPTDIYFPEDYEGQAGDEFYISLAHEKQIITLKYVVRARGESPVKLEYYCKDRWENFKPPAGKFEQYQNINGSWTSA